jgi:hypothetical protein
MLANERHERMRRFRAWLVAAGSVLVLTLGLIAAIWLHR